MSRSSAHTKIIYTDSVDEYFSELIDILYYNNYFNYKENAYQYVATLMNDIQTTIHLRPPKEASTYFEKYGENLLYTYYIKSKNTTWYIFFTYHPNETYYIRYASNNHVAGHLL